MIKRRVGPRESLVPKGDNRQRLSCPDCGFIEYQNPKIIVGAVLSWQDRILLCRRAIEPRVGFWTIPAGYMELGESVKEGALREAQEEACIGPLRGELESLAIYTVRRAGQVHLIFKGKLAEEKASAGVESLEVGFFSEQEIPWAELAFPTVEWALKHYLEQQNECESGNRKPPYFNPLPNESDPPPML